ncbi:hypothetical protein B0I35DRAFT_29964 [Stachybotrys elegans]|uniref:Mid2 domain-containing protein n=1 Tax=Stachybotrys elegans TaxID=80388 RepID=A0A8K0T1R0_9HYPO|nr:hypothetical protein B0I35DRAFT_29964 [Stachybotrys elegans]
MLVTASLLVFGTPLAAAANHALRKSGAESSWTAPRETSPAEMHAAQVALGWSPRPTEVPRDLMGRMLVPRMDDYTLGPRTCGFDSADGISITCISQDATCTYQTSHIGCCEPNSPCNIIKTTCMNYAASSAGSCNLPRDYHTLCCSARDRPACFEYILSTTGSGSEPDQTFTLFDCSVSSGTGTLFDYDPAWAATHSFASPSTESSEPVPTTTETDEPTGGSGDDGGNGDSTPIGAIVGGTVGGVAALGLVGAALFFLLRRRRDKAAAAKPAAAPMAQNPPMSPPPQSLHPSSPGGASYLSGVPSTFQGYDQQHMSMYGHPGYNQQGMQGYPPQQFQGQYPPQGFPQQQQQQQQGGFPYSPTGYQPVPSVSPPPQSTPSPAFKDAPQPQPAQNVNELQAINPVGNESNRAELGP